MKSIIVTGANSGIGKEAALMLAKAGHQVIMLCRDSEKSRQAHKDIMAQSSNQNVSLVSVDLASRQQIKSVVHQIEQQYETIDVLINNAGLYKVKRAETDDGLEMTFAVNFLAPFMLSQLLLDKLKASGKGRIVNVVSELYKNGRIDFNDLMLTKKYKAGDAYANSKMATVLYTIELAKQVATDNICVNALHPGILATNAFRDYPKIFVSLLNLFLEKPEHGGERIAHLALSDKLDGITGKYFYKDEQRDFNIDTTIWSQTDKLINFAQDLVTET